MPVIPASLAACLSLLSTNPTVEAARHERRRNLEVAHLIRVAEPGLETAARGRWIHENPDDSVATGAVRRLGLLRAGKAVPLLVKHIGFEPWTGVAATRFKNLSESQPCVFALAQIGSPCFGPVIDYVTTDGSRIAIQRGGIILKIALGCDDAVALVRARARQEKDKIRAGRLCSLADWIDYNERETAYE